MDTSPSIGELAKALAKAQGCMKAAQKTKSNPFFKSKYADLEATWDACRDALSKNGLSIVQMPFDNDGRIGVETMLLHESGEWIKGNLAVRMAKDNDPQNAGSIMSYLRRYSLQAAVGIATEDDDGNAASGKAAPVDNVPKVDVDDAVIATLVAAKTVPELQAAWEAIPAAKRSGYKEAKEAAKARIAKGAAA